MLSNKKSEFDTATFDYIYSEAIRFKLLGNDGDAINLFEESLKINPQSDAVYFNLAQLFLAKGNIPQAKKYIKSAISIDENNMWYLMMLSNIYYQENIIDSTIYVYEKLVSKYPEKIDFKISLGGLYSEKSDLKKANEIFEEIESKYGPNESTSALYVQNLISTGSLQKALEKSLELVSLNPDEIIYSGLLAEVYKALGENEKALDVYTDLIENNPENPNVQVALFDSDYTNMKGEELLLSLLVFEQLTPGNSITVLLRPDLLSRMGRDEEAIGNFEEIIKNDQNNFYAWESLLLLYYNHKNFEILEPKARTYSRLNNMSFLAKVLYATAASSNENFDTALEELRKASILAGNNKDMMIQVLSQKADVYFKMGEFENSFVIFEEALTIHNNDILILNNYAYYLAEKGLNLSYANDMAKKVIQQEPLNTTYLDTYGWVLYKQKKYRAAQKVFLKIMELEDNPDAIYYEHLGYVYKARKKCGLAIEAWKTALELDGSNENLKAEILKCED
jgi:tetratricopeptide (TPR) repeat protein